MGRCRRDPRRQRRAAGLLAMLALIGAASAARGQAPEIDIPELPGIPEGRGRLGPAPGASGATSIQNLENLQRPIGGRPGPSVSRAPVGALAEPAVRLYEPPPRFKPIELKPASLPAVSMEPPPGPEDIGPPNGLTLDAAIERLVQQNLTLLALRYEIPMADADVLTAGLRANPIFYADSQLVPYGRYSNGRAGGPTQYDVNITYPLDVTGKRRARVQVARQARRATEAQLQDAIRLQIDNLYTAYVDVVAADETLRYTRTFVAGLTQIYQLRLRRQQLGAGAPQTIFNLRAQLEQAQLQLREATEALTTANRALALLLNLPLNEADHLRVRAALRDVRPLPETSEALVRRALDARPDLMATRLGLGRAMAEVGLAKANRYSDVYLLYQPYTYQDNRPYGLRSPTSWAVGVTANLPIYNRNQGNIRRAQWNVGQTRVELTAMERQVIFDVEAGVREFNLSLSSVREYEREVLPASGQARDLAQRQFMAGAINTLEFLEARRAYNEVFRSYRDALIRHRRAMLDLNTAVGARVLP